MQTDISASDKHLEIHNLETVALESIPLLKQDDFHEHILKLTDAGARAVNLFGVPVSGDTVRLYAILAIDRKSKLLITATDIKETYNSLTASATQFHMFERELSEQFNIEQNGHPWLKPVRFEAPHCNPEKAVNTQSPVAPVIGRKDFFQVEGDEIHEVAVGPVHAGIIEPGHFRFQCQGERVLHLEISLGYQHRGIEKALKGGPDKKTDFYMETLAGDSSIGHTTAYCQAVEALAGLAVPTRAQAIRALALELERLANHTGDLGALANDVAYLPTASFCGRLRGDFLNLTALICGNRFGRSLVRPGGVLFDLDENLIEEATKRLKVIEKDVSDAINLLWNTNSVMDRFEDTGIVTKAIALQLGLVGPVARASGVERDVRFDHPTGFYRFVQIPVSVYERGDVFARAFVRWMEIKRSIQFIKEQLHALPHGGIKKGLPQIAPNKLVVSLVEGWRGEICHTILTNAEGKFNHYKIVDPSFHNWTGLAMALRDEEISNFPVCNKSFNLSYCGFDL